MNTANVLKASAGIVFSVLFMVPGAPARAQNPSCEIPSVSDGPEAINGLNDLRIDGCLGGRRCSSDLCARVAAFEQTWQQAELTAESFTQAGDLYRSIRGEASQLNKEVLGARQLNAMLAAWSPVMSGTDTTEATIQTRLTREWKPSIFTLFTGTDHVVHLKRELEDCENPAACRQDLSEAVVVYSYSVLVHRILLTLLSDSTTEFGDYLNRLDGRWQAYLQNSRAFYPWELLVNGWFYKPRQQGFSEPPDLQLLVLHPNAAFAYVDSADDRLEEALVMDIVGFYRWTWGGDDQDTIVNPLGLSLAVSWDGDSTGYGVSAHFPKNYSVSLTTNGDDTFLLFSVDLGNFILDKRKSIDSFRDRLIE